MKIYTGTENKQKPMKQTSINANNLAESSGLKLSHQKRILAVLENINNSMCYIEIAANCGLTPNEVHRRMGELERKGKVKILKERNGYSLYYKPVIEHELLSAHAYKYKQFKQWQKQASNFAAFMGESLIKEIQEIN